MKTWKVILAVLAAATVGAAFGVLFAPDKGSNTRKKITRKGEDVIDALKGRIDEKFDELSEAISGKVRREGTQNISSMRKPEMVE